MAQARSRVMGTDAHVVVVHDDATRAEELVASAAPFLEDLEARWSRFRPDSELSRLNASAGRGPVVVSAPTFEVIELAIAGSSATGGAFDPTVLGALIAAGYDRDFAALAADRTTPPVAAPAAPARPAPGRAGVVLDRVVGSVTLAPGVGLDLGGIGKGHAADLLAERLRTAGAQGVCVNLGGDLRVGGRSPTPGAWTVGLEVATRRPSPVLALRDGGVATTSSARRRWTRGTTVAHHVIDPRRGTPADGPWSSATVVASSAATAEIIATAVFLAPDADAARARVADLRAAALVVDHEGDVVLLGPIDAYLLD